MGSSFSSIGHSMRRRAVTSSAVAWAPDDLGNLAWWVDFDDSSNVSTSGSTITGVTDKAGLHTFSIGNTPTILSNGLNSRDVADFDGNGEYIQSSSYTSNQAISGNHWSVGVFQFHGSNSTQDSLWSVETNQSPKRDYAISSGASNNTWPGELDLDGLSSNRISSTIGNLQQWNLKSLSSFTWQIVGVFFNKTGNQIGVRVDGSNAFTPVNDYDNSLQSRQQVRFMRNRASQELDGRMAESIAYARQPGTSGTDMTYFEKAEGYLAHKWGLTGRLPSSHPYKSSAPTV
jgi:hypothetical protein